MLLQEICAHFPLDYRLLLLKLIKRPRLTIAVDVMMMAVGLKFLYTSMICPVALSINLITHNRSIYQSQIITLYWHCIGAERCATCECTCKCVRTRVPEQDSQNSFVIPDSQGKRTCLSCNDIDCCPVTFWIDQISFKSGLFYTFIFCQR